MAEPPNNEQDSEAAWQQVMARFQSVVTLARNNQRATSRGAKWLRGGLLTVGGLMSAAAGAFTDPVLTFDRSEIIILVGALMAFFGGLHDLVFTQTPADETFEASTAAAALLSAQREIEQHKSNGFYTYYTLVRLRELLQAVLSARSIIEGVLTSSERGDVVSSMQAMLRACQAQLRSALSFPAGHHWTLCIYRVEQDEKGPLLRCIAQDRYLTCSLEDARTWRLGESVPGQVMLRGEAVTVDDLFQEGSEGALAVPEASRKPADARRYRSLTGHPIFLGPNDQLWGVVVGSCALPGFFSQHSAEELNPVEVVRVVSEMAATMAAAYVTVEPA